MMMNRGFIRGRTALDNDALLRRAPSIFAEAAFSGVSDRYSFLPTIEIVDRMRAADWAPVEVQEQRVRLDERRGFQKHLIKFARMADVERLARAMADGRKGEYIAEISLLNSHDRSSAYQLHAGLFRLACSNGMIVSDGTFETIRIKHSGFDPRSVIEGSCKILESIPALTDKVEGFRALQLSPPAQTALAEAALILKYGDLSAAPVRPELLLSARRVEDHGADMWTTLNRVQENVIRGGLKDRSKRRPDGKRFKMTGEVKGIDENIRLNKALWHIADAMKAQLV